MNAREAKRKGSQLPEGGAKKGPRSIKPAPSRSRRRVLAIDKPAPANGSRNQASEDEASVTSVEQATNLIRQAVIQGRYGPGERIKISETAEQFGVSAMPVREALRKLEGEGIVSI